MLAWDTQRTRRGMRARKNSFASAMFDVMLSSTKKKKLVRFRAERISSSTTSIGRRTWVEPKYDWTAQKSHLK